MFLFLVWLRLKFVDIPKEKVEGDGKRKRVNVKNKVIGLLGHRRKDKPG